MVEMLGVLAIIGVLTVGGIAGFQKAMMKYKLNKLSISLNQLISDFLSIQYQLEIPNYSRLYHAKLMSDLGMQPEHSILKTNRFNFPQLGLNIYPFTDKRLTDGNGQSHFGFLFELGTIENKTYSVEICKTILQVAKHHHADIREGYGYSFSNNKFYIFRGDIMCYKGAKSCLKDLSITDITNICATDPERFNVQLTFSIK